MPYSPPELAALWSWRCGLPEGGPQENIGVLLAACLGAGLSSEDLIPARGNHVRVASNGAVVMDIFGRRPRLAVCRRDWEGILADGASRAGDRFLFRVERETCAKNTISNYVTKFAKPELCPPLSAQRCRATWIVQHLTDRTPVAVLIAAAGVDTLHALSRYLVFVLDMSDEEKVSYLRGHSA